MTSSSATPLRFYGSRIDCLRSVVGTFAHILYIYILTMLAATVVVPCLSGHIRAPGSSGFGVVAGVPGRAPLRVFFVRLRSLRAAAVLRLVHGDDVWRVARRPRPSRLRSRAAGAR